MKLLILLFLAFQTARLSNSRLGSTLTETQLTPTSVGTGKFRLLGSYPITGNTYSQPLYVPGATNRLIQATMNEDVYAFDADKTGVQLWHVNLGTPRTGYPTNGGEQLYYGVAVGCVSTPAVDAVNGWVFVACTNMTPTWILYKLNLATGATISTVTLTGQVVGTGDPTGGDTTSGANLIFFPAFEFQRSALLIANGKVYVAFGSYDDVHPWHGWVFSVDETAMTISTLVCTSPNGYGAAIWWAGGMAADGSGNLYGLTGNGDWDGTANFSESFVKYSAALSLLDFFTPTNWAAMTAADQDMSAGPFLVPGTAQVAGAAKDGRVFSVDSTCMGHLGGTVGGCTPQIFGSGDRYLVAQFMNGLGFFSTSNFSGGDPIKTFSISGSTWNTTAVTGASSFFPGAITAGTSNGGSTGILWAVTVAANAATTAQPAILRALNPANPATEYWNSSTSGHDTLGNMSKYTSPTAVGNGKVYVATQSGAVQVYGLVPAAQMRGQASFRGQGGIR